MSDGPSMIDMLLAWESAHQEGRDLSPEELGAASPEQAAELRRRIAELRAFPPAVRRERSSAESSHSGPAKTPPMPLGRPSDRYELRREVARGGMGIVHRAWDRLLHREVALKLMDPRYEANEQRVNRFIEEAQVTGQLQHPGIPPIFDQGVLPDGRLFFAMKLVKGRTLSDLLGLATSDRPGSTLAPAAATTAPTRSAEHLMQPPDLVAKVAIFEAVCQTLAYAHRKCVIHRDLKPSNIMVGAHGEVQVMDWGLAKVLGRPEAAPEQEATTLVHSLRIESDFWLDSRYGSVLGTLAYMAPEQARGDLDEVDERSDVFALGSLLCVLLTGHPPYTGPTSEDVRRQAVVGDVKAARKRLDACGADSALIGLAKECLAHDPDARPAHAGALATRVAPILARLRWKQRRGKPLKALAARIGLSHAWTRTGTRPPAWLVGALVLLACAAALGLGTVAVLLYRIIQG